MTSHLLHRNDFADPSRRWPCCPGVTSRGRPPVRTVPAKTNTVVFTDRSEQRQQRAIDDRTRPFVHPGDTLVRDLQPRPPRPRRPLRFRLHSEHVAGTGRGRKIHHRRRAGMIRLPPHHRGTTRDVRVTVVSVCPRQPHRGRNRAAVAGEQRRRGIRRSVPPNRASNANPASSHAVSSPPPNAAADTLTLPPRALAR